jgi:hypothetical protein
VLAGSLFALVEMSAVDHVAVGLEAMSRVSQFNSLSGTIVHL